MKKALSIILALIMVLSTIPFAYAAESETSGQCGENAYWNYDETTKTLYITGEGPMWDYEKNNTLFCDFGYEIEELNVESGITAIGDYTFSFLHGVTEIVLPETVKEIGEGAFFALTDTEMIYIPGSVKLIGAYAFGNCARLKVIILPRTAEAIGDHAFDGSDSVREIIFAEPVFVPGLDNFETMEYLHQSGRGDIVMGEGNEDFLNDRIVHLSFYERLYHPLIAPTCNTVGYTASINCDECEGLAYGETLIPRISCNDSDLDAHCDSCGRELPLTVKEGEPFTVKTHSEHYEVFYFTPEKTGTYVFSSDITNSLFIALFDLSTGEYIRDNYDIYNQGNYITPFINHLEAGKTYYYRIDRLGADVPLEVTYSIFCYKEDGYKTSGQCGDNAYWEYDEETKTITVSGTGEMWDVTESKYGFPIPFGNAYANYAEKIVIGEGITKVGNSAFFGFMCVNEITLPDSLKEINQYAFAWNYNLRKINFGECLEIIGYGAFDECMVISEVVLPSSVKRIEHSAFAGCFNLKNIKLNEGLEYLAEDALCNTFSLEEIEIPSTVKEIGDMTEIIFSSPIKSIINNSPTAVIFGEETFDAEENIEFPTERSREIVAYTYSTLYSLIAQVYLTPEKPYDDEVDEALRQKTIEAVNEKFGTSYKSIDDIDYEYFDAVYNLPDYITISCLHDSDQHEQCKEFSIDHSIIDSTCDDACGKHNIYTNDIMEPTCTENGYEGGVVCLDCEKIFEAATVIPAKGHSETIKQGLAPTCTEPGCTDTKVCSECGAVLEDVRLIQPKGHTDNDNNGICDECGDVIDGYEPEEVPETFSQRIINFFKGIVNAILELFKRLFG